MESSKYYLPPEIWIKIISYVMTEKPQDELDTHRSGTPKQQYKMTIFNFRGVNQYSQNLVDTTVLRNAVLFGFGLINYLPVAGLVTFLNLDKEVSAKLKTEILDSTVFNSYSKRRKIMDFLYKSGIDTRCIFPIKDKMVVRWFKNKYKLYSKGTETIKETDFRNMIEMLNGIYITPSWSNYRSYRIGCCKKMLLLSKSLLFSYVSYRLMRCTLCCGMGRDSNYQSNGPPSLNKCCKLAHVATDREASTDSYRRQHGSIRGKLSEEELVKHYSIQNAFCDNMFQKIVSTFCNSWKCKMCYLLYHKATASYFFPRTVPWKNDEFMISVNKAQESLAYDPHEILYNSPFTRCGNSQYNYLGAFRVNNGIINMDDYKKVTQSKHDLTEKAKRKFDMTISSQIWSSPKRARTYFKSGFKHCPTSWTKEGCRLAVAYTKKALSIYCVEKYYKKGTCTL